MLWEILILILGIISSLYAFPYGNWEWSAKNKIGGISIYIAAIICIILSAAQIFL